MSITSPIGHGPINATVRFNESPPLYYKHEIIQDRAFAIESGLTPMIEDGRIRFSGEHYQILPEIGGLYGIALKPRQEHYHNFLYRYGLSDVIYPDHRGVATSLTNDGRNELLKFFGWKVRPGWYREEVDGTLIDTVFQLDI